MCEQVKIPTKIKITAYVTHVIFFILTARLAPILINAVRATKESGSTYWQISSLLCVSCSRYTPGCLIPYFKLYITTINGLLFTGSLLTIIRSF